MKQKLVSCRWCGKPFILPKDSVNYVEHLAKSHNCFSKKKNGIPNLL